MLSLDFARDKTRKTSLSIYSHLETETAQNGSQHIGRVWKMKKGLGEIESIFIRLEIRNRGLEEDWNRTAMQTLTWEFVLDFFDKIMFQESSQP